MSNKNIQVNYDPESDVLSMASSATAPIDHAREMGNLVVHFGKNDEPVLIEVLDASHTLKSEIAPMAKVAAATRE